MEPTRRATRVRARRTAGAGTVAGLVIAIAGGAFVARAIAVRWASVRTSISHARPGWLVAGAVVAALAMLAIALPWRRVLSVVGLEVDTASTVAWYFVGEIGKYVPGGIWPVVGRGELVRRGGHPRGPAYASVALSLATLYLSAMLVAAVLLPVRYVHRGHAEALWVLVLLPVGVGLLHHRALGRIVAVVERVLGRGIDVDVPPWSTSLTLILCYVPSWLMIGTATWCLARAFAPGAAWATVAPAAILSWVIGFVVVPVPGGVGVREAAFVALTGASMPVGSAATVAVVARLGFMLVDVLGAVLGAVAWRRLGPARARAH